MASLISNNEVLARLKPFGILFEKSLADLIKGIRHHSKILPESLLEFLEAAIQECRDELSTTDLETKAMAILKLTYLEMYGFDMSWCNFQILEIMSSSKFQQKRIGYLAAIQLFKNEQDLLILATNQFKKDLNSNNPFEVGLALSGIATIVTPNLAKDINDDVLLKLTHTKPYVRKKAILAMYKIFLQYPDSLRSNFQRVVQILDDPDISVVSAAINVICEISKKSPTVFMNYLPKFFTIMEDSKNNWLIIRILKLFQSLLKVEPRMKKKILPTIIDLMVSTQASSLIYECINCIVSGSMLNQELLKDRDIASLCIEQIMKFFDTRDSNLKYVGLLALINILELFPVLIRKSKEISTIIMNCLTDNDMLIKTKALEISHYMITEDNIVDVVKVLLLQLIPGDDNIDVPENYKLNVVFKILEVASEDNYTNVPNLRWYVAVLKDMINLTLLPLPNSTTTAPNVSEEVAELISLAIGTEFKTLATKIPSIRSEVVSRVIFQFCQDLNVLDSCPILLRDFYWILGEYIDELKEFNDDENDFSSSSLLPVDTGKKIQIFNTFVNKYVDQELRLLNIASNYFPISSSITSLKVNDLLAVFIQALVKIFSGIVRDYVSLYSKDQLIAHERFLELQFNLWKLIQYLKSWENHIHYEVQERAVSWLDFLNLCLEAMGGKETDMERMKADEIQYYKNKKPEIGSDSGSSDNSDEESEEEDEESDQESSDDDESSDESVQAAHTAAFKGEYDEINEAESQNSLNDLTSNPFSQQDSLPPLLTHVLSSFFTTYQLNPIAKDAQINIPVPDLLDIETQINQFDALDFSDEELSDTDPLIDLHDVSDPEDEPLIQLHSVDEEQKRKERKERHKDDPFYITSEEKKTEKSKSKSRLAKQTFLVDQPGSGASSEMVSISSKTSKKPKHKVKKEKIVILAEEQIPKSGQQLPVFQLLSSMDNVTKPPKKKKNQLRIDSSNLDNFDLNRPSEDVLGNDDDYEVDLDALRKKLLDQVLSEPKEKKKKKKEKSKKDVKDGKDTRKKTKKNDIETATELLDPVTNNEVVETVNGEEESRSSPSDSVIEVKKTTKKKKKRAVIT